MQPVVVVLKAAAKVEDCGSKEGVTYREKCRRCMAQNNASQQNHPEALLECREKGYVVWKNMCGWTLTREGKHFYNALRGKYYEDRSYKVKPPIE